VLRATPERRTRREAMQHQDFVRSRAMKYSGILSLVIAMINIGFGTFLLWVTFTRNGACDHQVPLFMQVAGWTALGYGSLFAIYACVSGIRSLRRAGYEEVDDHLNDSVFENSTVLERRSNLAEAAKPSGFTSLIGCFMFLVALFRLAWLIFGSVEIFKSTPASCEDFYVPCLAYVIAQWSMIGLFLFVACIGCVCLAYCATLLGRG